QLGGELLRVPLDLVDGDHRQLHREVPLERVDRRVDARLRVRGDDLREVGDPAVPRARVRDVGGGERGGEGGREQEHGPSLTRVRAAPRCRPRSRRDSRPAWPIVTSARTCSVAPTSRPPTWT
ncbi:MAG: hypothetical protein ACK56I_25650, partial [bacterium]